MILQLILIKLQENRTTQLSKYFINFLCTIAFTSTHGVNYIYNMLETIQAGMTSMIIHDIWGTSTQIDYMIQTCDTIELNQILLGGLEFLINSPIVMNSNTWIQLFKILLYLLTSSSGGASGSSSSKVDTTHLFDEDIESREFDSTYSKLAYAHIIEVINPILEGNLTDIKMKFCQTLSEFCKTSPGKYSNLLHNQLTKEEQNLLQELLMETGCEIV